MVHNHRISGSAESDDDSDLDEDEEEEEVPTFVPSLRKFVHSLSHLSSDETMPKTS